MVISRNSFGGLVFIRLFGIEHALEKFGGFTFRFGRVDTLRNLVLLVVKLMDLS